MKKIVISLLFLMISGYSHAGFIWSSYGLLFEGEREPVLALASQVSDLYKVDEVERVVNRLIDEKKKLQVKTYINENEDYFISYQYLLSELGDSSGLQILTENELAQKIEEERVETITFGDYDFITIQGRADKLALMKKRMDKILANDLGRALFEKMRECGHSLFIYDDKSSLSGAGYTSANPTTFDVFIPGKGAKSRIRMRFDQPDSGAHSVGAETGSIPFLAIDNIYHELVHAKHIMCGTMSRTNAEAQAIAEENDFRASREETRNWPARDSAQYEDGVQTWFGLY